MTEVLEVFLKYNPYKVETSIQIDGKPIHSDSKLAPFRKERLQLWVDQLIPVLVEELNDDSYTLVFQGTAFDYEDIIEVCSQYNIDRNASIELRHIPAEGSEDKIGDLEALFHHMQDGPFEELRSEGIRRNFEKALSSDFEIAVIATMSSGKSTLINSILGKELMPAKAKACTATIASIKNVDGHKAFKGRCLDAEGHVIEPWQTIEAEDMQRFNENEEVSNIEIEGDIPEISSKKMNLILVDTPGPNNSRNSSHRDHTYRVIKSDTKPMVLYILNASQFAINDDNDLLNSVAEQMKSGGKQSKDRFIFAVNKVDDLDPDPNQDGSIAETLREVREYLEEKGIENPNIFPVSAEVAKLIRMYQDGQPMTTKQKRKLRDHELFIDEQEFHLNKYAPLSRLRKERLADRVNRAIEREDMYEEALVYTGVPSIEEAINEYLEKYAVTSKIATAVNSFKDIVNGKQLDNNLREELSTNQEKRKEINAQMKKLKAEIDQGQRAKQLKERINRKSFDQHEVIRRVEMKIERKIDDASYFFREKERVEQNEAKQIIERLQQEISSLQSDIKTDLEMIILATLKRDTVNLLEEYKEYVKDLIDVSGDALQGDDFNLFIQDLPNAENIVEELSYKDDVATGTTWVSTSKWWNPFSWGDGYNKTVYTTKTFVNVDDIASEFIYPTKESLYDSIEQAEEYIKDEEKRLKTYFNREIDKLEKLLLKKVEEIENLSSNSDYLEEKLRSDKDKYDWLQEFVVRLDSILEI